MPLRYQIYEPSFLHIFASGDLTAEEYFQAVEAFMKEEEFYPSMPVLFEAGYTAQMAAEEVDFELAEKRGSIVKEIRGDAQYRVAISGGSADLRSFIAMVQDLINNRARCRTFESVIEAREWLLS